MDRKIAVIMFSDLVGKHIDELRDMSVDIYTQWYICFGSEDYQIPIRVYYPFVIITVDGIKSIGVEVDFVNAQKFYEPESLVNRIKSYHVFFEIDEDTRVITHCISKIDNTKSK